MEEKNRHISIAVLCAVALVALLLGLGLGLNALLLPEDVAPSAPTEPPTEPPTDPPTDPPTGPPTDPPTEPPLALPELSLTAKHGFLYVVETGAFLTIKGDMGQRIYPASITKLFSTYVALLYLDPQETVTIGNERDLVAMDASIAGLQKGTTWTVEGLAYAALLPSGCDASYSLATAAGRKLLDNPNATVKKAIAAFMDECNRLAEELGMTNTHFVTPDGYHDWNHYISIRGYMIIAKLILGHELLSSIAKTPQATVTYRNKYGTPYTTVMRNTNYTLHADSPQLYRPESVGLKTGSTSAAGKCLLTAYQVEGGYLIVGVFGCIETTSRFTSANALFDYFIAQRGPEYPYNKDPGITPGSFHFI